MTEIICYYTEHPGFDIVDHYQFEIEDGDTLESVREYINQWAKTHWLPTLDEPYNPIQDHIESFRIGLDRKKQTFEVRRPYKD